MEKQQIELVCSWARCTPFNSILPLPSPHTHTPARAYAEWERMMCTVRGATHINRNQFINKWCMWTNVLVALHLCRHLLLSFFFLMLLPLPSTTTVYIYTHRSLITARGLSTWNVCLFHSVWNVFWYLATKITCLVCISWHLKNYIIDGRFKLITKKENRKRGYHGLRFR